MNYLMNILLFLIFIVALAILFKIFKNAFMKTEGMTGLLFKVVFYLPCIWLDIVEYVREEMRITPNIVYILFVLEILLILAYIYLPDAFKKLIATNGIIVQRDPVFLDAKPVIVASSDDLIGKNKDYPKPSSLIYQTNVINASPQLKNYSVSAWIFINNQSFENTAYIGEKNILSLGYTDTQRNMFHYKPQITYDQKSKGFYVYLSTYKPETKEGVRYRLTNISSQKWHNFIITYNNNSVDLFIDGRLERTFSLASSMPEYSSNDLITLGDTGGIQGAICNVVFYTTPLTQYKAANIYNIHKIFNPPIM
jgi:hypothetical protein